MARNTHTHTHPHPHTPTPTHTRTLTHPHSHTRTLTHATPGTHSTHTHTHTHAHSHTHTHTHLHALTQVRAFLWSLADRRAFIVRWADNSCRQFLPHVRAHEHSPANTPARTWHPHTRTRTHTNTRTGARACRCAAARSSGTSPRRTRVTVRPIPKRLICFSRNHVCTITENYARAFFVQSLSEKPFSESRFGGTVVGRSPGRGHRVLSRERHAHPHTRTQTRARAHTSGA